MFYVDKIVSVETDEDGLNLTAEVIFSNKGTKTPGTLRGEYAVFESEDSEAHRWGFYCDGWACDAFFYDASATVENLRELSRMVWDKYHAGA